MLSPQVHSLPRALSSFQTPSLACPSGWTCSPTDSAFCRATLECGSLMRFHLHALLPLAEGRTQTALTCMGQ